MTSEIKKDPHLLIFAILIILGNIDFIGDTNNNHLNTDIHESHNTGASETFNFLIINLKQSISSFMSKVQMQEYMTHSLIV